MSYVLDRPYLIPTRSMLATDNPAVGGGPRLWSLADDPLPLKPPSSQPLIAHALKQRHQPMEALPVCQPLALAQRDERVSRAHGHPSRDGVGRLVGAFPALARRDRVCSTKP